MNKMIATLINVKNTMKYNSHVRATMKELNRLSNHDLNDIGIARGDIYHIAHTSYTKPEKVTARDIEAELKLEPNSNLKGFV